MSYLLFVNHLFTCVVVKQCFSAISDFLTFVGYGFMALSHNQVVSPSVTGFGKGTPFLLASLICILIGSPDSLRRNWPSTWCITLISCITWRPRMEAIEWEQVVSYSRGFELIGEVGVAITCSRFWRPAKGNPEWVDPFDWFIKKIPLLIGLADDWVFGALEVLGKTAFATTLIREFKWNLRKNKNYNKKKYTKNA